MRKTILVSILLSASFACLGATPSVESLDTLLVVSKTESLINSMYAQIEQLMAQTMQQAIAGKTLTAEQREAVEAAPKQFVEIMKNELSWANMKPMYINIYQETFSQDEIDGLIAFYRSPAGAAFIDKMPLVLQKTNVAMQSRIPPLLEKMKAAREKVLADAKISKPAAGG
jgi:hypothetical protein